MNFSERTKRNAIAVEYLPLARRAVWNRFKDDPYTLRHIDDLISVAYERIVKLSRSQTIADLTTPAFKSFVYKAVINACYSWIRDQGRCFRDKDTKGISQIKAVTETSSSDNVANEAERECNRAIALDLIERGKLSAKNHQAMLLWLDGLSNAEVEQRLSLKGAKAGIKIKWKCVKRIRELAVSEQLMQKVAL